MIVGSRACLAAVARSRCSVPGSDRRVGADGVSNRRTESTRRARNACARPYPAATTQSAWLVQCHNRMRRARLGYKVWRTMRYSDGVEPARPARQERGVAGSNRLQITGRTTTKILAPQRLPAGPHGATPPSTHPEPHLTKLWRAACRRGHSPRYLPGTGESPASPTTGPCTHMHENVFGVQLSLDIHASQRDVPTGRRLRARLLHRPPQPPPRGARIPTRARPRPSAATTRCGPHRRRCVRAAP
jgi:hypothetical protein